MVVTEHHGNGKSVQKQDDAPLEPTRKDGIPSCRRRRRHRHIFAGLLCTVPYGILAERIGRKRVLVLSGAGLLASLSWVLAVCYWRFIPIRWIWLSGVFLFIGGGDAVTSSVVHVMVTDITEPAERAQIFMYLHAADVISGLVGPIISAALMEQAHVWAVLLLAELVLFTGDSRNPSPSPSLSPPEPSESPTPSTQRSSSPSHATTTEPTTLARICDLLAPLLTVLSSNRQALLLLCLFAPQTAARELFTMIGLRYSSARYSLPYAQGNVLLSLFQGAQGMLVLVLLPLVTYSTADPRGWTPWVRDRVNTIVSITMTASGLLAIAAAPTLPVEATGLVLVALGSCTVGLLMSLLGRAVAASQVSTFYTLALTLSIVVRSLTGPMANGLLVKGLELGGHWMGLPFAAMALLMAAMAVASGFISTESGSLTSL